MARQPTDFEAAPVSDTGMKYEQMTRGQKVWFVTKVVVCVATFGFAFPNVQSD